MTTSSFDVVAIYRAKPGQGPIVAKNLDYLAEASRAEPGNLRYEVFRGLRNKDSFAIIESYRAADDFQVHRNSEHFRNIAANTIMPLLESRDVSTYEQKPTAK